MRTINLDAEIVATRYDPVSRTCFYTVQRDGCRWTVSIHEDDLNRHKGDKQKRRNHLGHLLQVAMQGKADGE
jgi:hypothetical protein